MAFRKLNHKIANAFSEDSPNVASEKTVFTSELEFMSLDCDQGNFYLIVNAAYLLSCKFLSPRFHRPVRKIAGNLSNAYI